MAGKLIALGIDTATADMRWDEEFLRVGYDKDMNKATQIPAWSLDALLDALGDSQLGVWHLDKLIMHNGYHLRTDSPVGGKTYTGKTKIEAVYNAVCDMLERRKVCK